MITVHHLEHSRSQRVLWLLEELALPYEIVRYKRDPETSLAPAALSKVHPLGKSPVITDGEVTVAETGAIVEYLIDTYGGGALKPSDPAALRDYRYWLHHAEGTAAATSVMKLIFTRIKERKMPFFARPVAKAIADTVLNQYINPNQAREIAFWEAALDGRDWFCGEEITGADIMMSFPVEAVWQRTGLDRCPNLAGFLAQVHDRAAYKAALEKGGPFNLGG